MKKVNFSLEAFAVGVDFIISANGLKEKDLKKIFNDQHIKLEEEHFEYDESSGSDHCMENIKIISGVHTICGESRNFTIHIPINTGINKPEIMISLDRPSKKSLLYFNRLFKQANIDLTMTTAAISIEFPLEKNENIENLFQFISDNINLKGDLDKYKIDNDHIYIRGDGQYFFKAEIFKMTLNETDQRVTCFLITRIRSVKNIKKCNLYTNNYFKGLVRNLVSFDSKQFSKEFINSLELQKSILLHP